MFIEDDGCSKYLETALGKRAGDKQEALKSLWRRLAYLASKANSLRAGLDTGSL